MSRPMFNNDLSSKEDMISTAPSSVVQMIDKIFRSLTLVFTWGIVLLLIFILWEFGSKAFPAIQEYGFGFLTTSTWDVNKGEFGILPEIWGTLYTSILALIFGGFFGITIAIFLTQDFLPPFIALVFKNIIELLAAIPSVVYGLWGIFVIIPLIRPLANSIHETLGWIPFFSTSLSGPGVFPAALVLSIMILPTVAAIAQDSLSAVPTKIKEAVYGMGATRWEAILRVILPAASHGIFGALVLGFGRALGETMALAMLVGNSNQISLSIFSPANTLASLLALNFPEAGEKETQILLYAALVLMLITLIVNLIGTAIITITSRSRGEQ